MFVVPSVCLGVVISQNAVPGQSESTQSRVEHSNATFLNLKSAPGQLKIPGQRKEKGQEKRPQYIPGEVLVKFKQGIDDSKKRNIHDKMDAEVLSEIRQIGVHKVKSKHGLSTEELINQYKNDPDVLFAEPNGIFHAQYNQMLPNDPYLDSLWGMSNANDHDIDAPEAWSLQTGSGVIVAVIDSGMDYTHPDLAANMVAGWDFTTCAQFYQDGSCATPKARDSDPMDDYGHGTHVAGTIAAVGNNSIGVVGVSMNSKIMPIKVLNANGYGSWADIAEGIIYASEHGAKISNNSYGGCCATSYYTIDAAIATARQNGTLLFVAAAGNEGSDNEKSPHYPCSSLEPNVICVSATDQNDALAFFSNYGATRVDLAAPGMDILSTVPRVSCIYCDPSGYLNMQGTSMAAPHVAGAAALAIAQFPTYTGDQIRNLLIGSVDPIAPLVGKVAGGGRLNVNSALRPGIAISAPPVTISAGQSVASTITVQSLNNFSGAVSLNFSSSDSNITGSLSTSSVTLNNDSQTVTLTAFSTSGVAAGVHSLVVTGTFTNAEGGTETRAGIVIVTIQTDVLITALSGSSTGEAGGWFTVSDTIQNQGTALAKGFYVGYYLSTDNVITDADVRIGSRWLPSLAAGSSNTSSTDVWIPSYLAADIYYIGAIVDDTQRVSDTNTANNSMPASTITITVSDPAAAVWVNRLTDSSANVDNRAFEINVDASGNSVVSGIVCTAFEFVSCVNYGITTIKYGPEGTILWKVTHDTDVSEWVVDQAMDGSGNVYIAMAACQTTECMSYSAIVIKYNSNGTTPWVTPVVYDMALLNALTVDKTGNFYLTGGWGIDGTCDSECLMATVKFDARGNKLWEEWGTTPTGLGGQAITVDETGNVYVTGNEDIPENWGFTTLKYGPNGGAPLWNARHAASSYNGTQGIALDADGNVYVAGDELVEYAPTDGDYDVVIVKYDNNGNELWARRYDNGGTDVLSKMLVDTSGNVYAAAASSNGMGLANADYATVKYDTNGNFQWVTFFNDSGQEFPYDLEIDNSGNAYLTGSANVFSIQGGWGAQDYATVKYGPNGHPQWYARYGNGSSDFGYALAVDGLGNAYVTGESGFPLATPSGTTVGFDFATVKYSTLQDTVAPSVPERLSARAASTTQINLTWRASTDNVGVTGYRIYRNGVQVGTPTGTSYSDTGLTAATSYSYKVAACDAAGNCSAQSSAVTGTTKRK